MSSRDRLWVFTRNLTANWVGHAASLLVMFFLMPYMIRTLGKSSYGVWSLLMTFTGYMGVLDLGIRASTGRYVILYLGRGDHERLDQTVRTGLGFFTGVGLLMVAAGAALGWLFPQWFQGVPDDQRTLVRLLLPLLALNVWLSAVSAILDSVLGGHDRFDVSQGIHLAVLAVRTTLTVGALAWGYGLAGLTTVSIGMSALGVLGRWWGARRIYPRLRVWPLQLERRRLRELFRYGIAAFLTSVAFRVIYQTDLVVVGAIVGVAAVAVYTVAGTLVSYSQGFISQIGVTFYPPIQRAAAVGDLPGVRRLMFRQIRMNLLLSLPLYLGFVFLGRPFIGLWQDAFSPTDADQAGWVLTILSAAAILGAVLSGLGSTLAAVGYVRFNAVIGIVEAAVNLGLSVLLAGALGWGMTGVACGTLVAIVVIRAIPLPVYALRRLRVSGREYLVGLTLPALASVGALSGVMLLARALPVGEGWTGFGVRVLLAAAAALVVEWFILIDRDERRLVVDAVRARLHGRAAPAVRVTRVADADPPDVVSAGPPPARRA